MNIPVRPAPKPEEIVATYFGIDPAGLVDASSGIIVKAHRLKDGTLYVERVYRSRT